MFPYEMFNTASNFKLPEIARRETSNAIWIARKEMAFHA
jgi:hypothetical protein